MSFDSADKQKKRYTHDMLRNGKTYAITINMSNDYQHFKKNGLHRPREVVANHMAFLAKRFNTWCEYELYPEISMAGRWHYHGILKVTDAFHYHVCEAHRIADTANVKIDVLLTEEDVNKFSGYMRKDRELMESSLKKLNLPYVLKNNVKVNHPRALDNGRRPILDFMDV